MPSIRKGKILILLCWLLLFMGCSYTPKQKKLSPVEYNNKIVNALEKVDMKFRAFLRCCQPRSGQSTFRNYDSLRLTINKSLKEMMELTTYSGDKGFKKAALELLRYDKNAVNNEFSKIVDILKYRYIPRDGDLNEEDQNILNGLLDKFEDKSEPLYEEVIKQQKLFSYNHDFTFTNSKGEENYEIMQKHLGLKDNR